MDTIPILSNLSNEQFDKLLGICTKKEFPVFTVIFEEGIKSDDMYILTEGTLKVYLKGKLINRIEPISTVGEMGMFTGEKRSASITTLTECTMLRIERKDLFDIFGKDKDFHIKFQEGMLMDLSHKIRLTNEVMAKLKSKLE